jgi:hypothetical protein
LRQVLSKSEKSRGELQTLVGVADSELKEYRQKVSTLEKTLAGKDAELLKQTADLQKKEAIAQRACEARSAAEDRVKQLMKWLQDLEASAMRKPLCLSLCCFAWLLVKLDVVFHV